jgi:lipopolysaccharide assembly protein A
MTRAMDNLGGLERPPNPLRAHSSISMRLFCFLLLVAFVAAIVVFVMQNKEDITLRYFDRSESYPLPLVVGIVYALGMLTGWTIVGLLKRSVQRVVTER